MSMGCSKARFPIRIIVFDELELIIFESLGLTLSTASLVLNIYRHKGLMTGSTNNIIAIQ